MSDHYDDAYEMGRRAGKRDAINLLDEVIEAYSSLYETDIHSYNKQQVNAVKFARSWIRDGGHEDLDGNRACLPW